MYIICRTVEEVKALLGDDVSAVVIKRQKQYRSAENTPTQFALVRGDIANTVRSLKIGQSKEIFAHYPASIRTPAIRAGYKVRINKLEECKFNVTRIE